MASNITKNFDQRKKFGLRMAAGGVIEQMNNLANLSNTDRYKLGMSGTAAEASALQERAGILSAIQPSTPAPAAAAPAAPAATQPVAKPYDHMAAVQSRGETISALGSKLRSMQQAAPKAASSPLDAGSSMAPMPKVGLRAGGVVDPEQSEVYEIEGPGDGSGVDDNVDVNVHGKNIKVSKGERFAVFPASVPKENIEEFIESQTGEPSATAKRGGLREGLRAFGGGVTDAGDLLEKLPKGNPVPVVDDFGNVVKPSAKSVIMGQQGARAVAPAATAATAPVQSAGRTVAARAALGPAMAVGTGVDLGIEAAKFVDSFPSLRGKATAASTDMTLAGTPQHDSEVNSELAAKDDTWRARHGKTLPGDAVAAVATSKGTPAVMTDSSDYGREGRIAAAQRAASLDQAKSGFDVPTDARVVTSDGTRMHVGQQKQDATELRPANGTGYVTGAADAKGLRKTIFLGGDQEKYTDVDGKPTTDWTKTQRYKDQIEINSRMAKLADTMERDRLSRDAFSPEIKDPRVQAAALAQLSRLDSRDDHRDVVGLRQQIIDTQKGALDLSNRQLDEVIRHNNFTEGAAATRAKEARAEQAVKNLDALIADQGLSEADANAFRDFMRANYFGRKHMVKGKEVDVPGMEDMSSDQMRALMPDAVMRYKWNRDFNKASRTGTSQHEAKGLRNRKINWSDVSKGPTGLPDLFSTDSKGKIPVFGEGSWFESVTPDIFRNINDNVIEEVDANGNPIRVALARDIDSDKTGSIDRSLYLKERGLK